MRALHLPTLAQILQAQALVQVPVQLLVQAQVLVPVLVQLSVQVLALPAQVLVPVSIRALVRHRPHLHLLSVSALVSVQASLSA
jgi:hypothetical protein